MAFSCKSHRQGHRQLNLATELAGFVNGNDSHVYILSGGRDSQGPMTERQTRIATVVTAMLGILVVAVMLGPRLLHFSAPAVKHLSANLPAGVCTLSTDRLPVSAATRMEAKLVTFDTAQSNDQYFPFRQDPSSSGPRINRPSPLPQYFWIVAAEGTFPDTAFQPLGTSAVGPFTGLIFYLAQDSCQVEQVRNWSGWPIWFDKMTAVADLKIK